MCCSPVAALKTVSRQQVWLMVWLLLLRVQAQKNSGVPTAGGRASAALPSHHIPGAGTLVLSGHNACIQPVSPVCCLTMITYQNCSPAFPATIHLSLLAAKPSIFPPAAWDHGRKLRGGWVLGRCSGYITHMHHSGIYCPFDKRVLLSHFYLL